MSYTGYLDGRQPPSARRAIPSLPTKIAGEPYPAGHAGGGGDGEGMVDWVLRAYETRAATAVPGAHRARPVHAARARRPISCDRVERLDECRGDHLRRPSESI